MSTEVKVPPFPESVEEGTLTTWYKKEGDRVEQDEKIADIETDKIVLEVVATTPGVLGALVIQEGATVKPGQTLSHIEASGDAAPKKEKKAKAKAKTDEPEVAKKEEPKTAPATPPLSPAVRRMVEDHDLDPAVLTGTGRGGLVTKADVLAHLEKAESEPAQKAAPVPEKAATPVEAAPPAEKPQAETAAAVPPAPKADGRTEQRVPMTRIRARIAERLVEAQQTAAILTTFNEVNLQAVMDLRARHRDAFEKKHGVKLGFMGFFAKASVEALKKFPAANASLDGKDVIYHGYIDIGMAVSTERGLVVPILRDVDQMSFADIEKAIVAKADRARKGQLDLAELTGGTFTITNGGVFGSMLSTPILNPPQSAILGMHKIQERPMAENGQVVIRPMMYLALSYDHRLIDGREAVQFLVAIKEALEDPARMLLDI